MKSKINIKPVVILLTSSLIIVGVVVLTLQALTSRTGNNSASPVLERPDRPINEIDTTPPTETEQNPITEQQGPPSQDKPTSSIPITITSSNQEGPTVRIRALVGEVLSSGTCNLILEKDGKQIQQSVEVFTLASSTTCKGFDIDTSQISKGVWGATLSVVSGSRSGSTEQEIVVR